MTPPRPVRAWAEPNRLGACSAASVGTASRMHRERRSNPPERALRRSSGSAERSVQRDPVGGGLHAPRELTVFSHGGRAARGGGKDGAVAPLLRAGGLRRP